MSKGVRHIIFSIVLLFLPWLWIRVSSGDEEDLEYNESDTRVFSVPISSARNHKIGRCRIPNVDDPKEKS